MAEVTRGRLSLQIVADVARLQRDLKKAKSDRLRGWTGVQQRRRRMARSHGLCEACRAEGRVRLATVVDHIKPLALGGSDEDTNTQNLCDPCHDKKTRKDFGFKEKKTIGVDGWPIE